MKVKWMHVLCKEGIAQDSLFLIHQGAASVTCQGQRVSELKSGDIFGELVALGLSPMTTATITATDTCFVQELHSKILLPALEKFPEERQKLRQLAALRMEWRYALHDLQNFDWIRGAPVGFPALLEQMLTRWIFFRGDEIMVQGTPGDSLIMISTGSVEVRHDDRVIRELGGMILTGP
ncbi:PKAR [Symbiodinium pilosum]|uniref:PKAR protein n=1 Tax=Symbiodinium pilosum TaxID=2952 RepID=A0A812U8T7_SYMPI|nr:PKAR [Symbiodinium pilosum]